MDMVLWCLDGWLLLRLQAGLHRLPVALLYAIQSVTVLRRVGSMHGVCLLFVSLYRTTQTETNTHVTRTRSQRHPVCV
jgi:hypothetical protein